MKKCLILYLLLISCYSFSQKIFFSQLDLKGKIILRIAGIDSSGIIIKQNNIGDNESKNGYTWLDEKLQFKRFDKDKELNKGLNMFKEVSMEHFFYKGNIVQLFFRREKKDYHELYLRYPFNSPDNRRVIKNSETPFYDKIGNPLHYNTFTSPVDGSILLICDGCSEFPEHNEMLLLDKNFKVLEKTKKPSSLSGLNTSIVGNYLITSNYQIIDRKKVIKYSYNFNDLITKNSFKIESPEIPDCYFTAMSSTHTEDGLIDLGVYVQEVDDDYKIKGVYRFETDFSEEKITSSLVQPLSQKGLDAFEDLKTEKGTRQAITSLFKMDDGNYFLVGESYQEIGDREKGSLVDKRNNRYFGIFVFAFDQNMNYLWSKKIDRKEKITPIITGVFGPSREEYGSFSCLPIENTLHIFYNDNKEVFDFSISTDKQEKSKPIIFDNKKSLTIFPNEGVIMDERSILFPCIVKGNSEIVKFEY